MMRPAISSQVFFPGVFDISHAERVRAAGIGAVELYALPPHADCADSTFIRETGEAVARVGIRVAAVHAPFTDAPSGRRTEWLSISDHVPERRRRAVARIEQCVLAAAELQCDLVVAHFGIRGDRHSTQTLSDILSSLIALAEFLEGKPVRVVFENIATAVSRTGYMRSLFERYDFRGFGICADLGHANISEDPVAALEEGADKVWHVHASDNNGTDDLHQLPLDGNIRWGKVMATLRRMQYDGAVVFECRPTTRVEPLFAEIAKRWQTLQELDEDDNPE